MKDSWRHSIRHRIMLIFVGLMTAVLLSVWAINNWWLEKYYIDEKRKEMEAAYEEIDAAVLDKTQDGESIGQVIAWELQKEWDTWSHPQKQEGEDGKDAGEVGIGRKEARARAADESWMEPEMSEEKEAGDEASGRTGNGEW